MAARSFNPIIHYGKLDNKKRPLWKAP